MSHPYTFHMPLLPLLESTQINSEFLYDRPLYIGALPKDEINRVPFRPSFGVVNNDNHTGAGTHWVCFYACPNQSSIICFDSMGAPPNQNMSNHCAKLSKLLNKPVVYSEKQIQELGTSSCGWFCIYVLKKLLSGESFSSILNEFSSIPSQNEQLLTRQFEKYHISNPNSRLPFPKTNLPPKIQKGRGFMRARQQSKKHQRLQQFNIIPSASSGVKLKVSKRKTPLKPKSKLPLERNPLGLLSNNNIRLPKSHSVPPPFNPLGLIMNPNFRVTPYIPTPSS